jgi:protein involved in polysaccharide export with SLBB domain
VSRCVLPLAFTLALTGCTGAQLFRAPPPVPSSPDLPLGEAGYRIGCADVLEVTFAERPEWDCFASVALDGRLPLGEAGSPEVELMTIEEVRSTIAALTGLDPSRIDVRVADPRAARVYICGPEAHRQRVVPYRGPEPVVAFLWRAGAVKQGCSDLHDVSVVRPNVAVGGKPEVFRVNVEAVVLDGDQSTNVVLRPSDQVYVGETRRSSFSRLLPDWIRPLYRKLVGMLPPDGWLWAGKPVDLTRNTPAR